MCASWRDAPSLVHCLMHPGTPGMKAFCMFLSIYPFLYMKDNQRCLRMDEKKALSSDRMDSLFFPVTPPPPPPLLKYSVEKRRDHGNLWYAHANFRGPASSQHYISGRRGGGGFTGKKSESIRSQLRALATRTPSLGHCGQGAWL